MTASIVVKVFGTSIAMSVCKGLYLDCHTLHQRCCLGFLIALSVLHDLHVRLRRMLLQYEKNELKRVLDLNEAATALY